MEADINGVRLFYVLEGEPTRPALVFLHGFPFSHKMWAPQITRFRKDFRVIAYDHRGHGQSAEGPAPVPLEFLVDDLFALLDHLKVSRAVVCGLSMGGYVALRAMERNPERFRALVLCDTRSEADSNEAKLKRFASIQLLQKQGVKPFAEAFLGMVFAPDTLKLKPDLVDSIRQVILRTPPSVLENTLMTLASRTDTSSALRKISAPTLILVGEHDLPTPPAAARSMQAQIPGAQLEVVPHAGHLSNLENPPLFNEHLAAFLAGLPAA